MGWNDLFHGVLNIILTFIDTLIQMKVKTQMGIAIINTIMAMTIINSSLFSLFFQTQIHNCLIIIDSIQSNLLTRNNK